MTIQATNYFPSNQFLVAEDKVSIQTLIGQKITGQNHFRTKQDLNARINKFDTDSIHKFLKSCASMSCDQEITSDPIKAFQKCASLLSLTQIEEALKTEHQSFDEALTDALKLVEKARYFIDKNGKKDLKHPLRRALSKTLQGVENTIETILKSFGLIDFFSSPDSEFEASFRVQKFMMLTTLLSGIATVILAVIGTPIASALIVGGLLLALAIFTALYVKFLKSTPSNLPNCKNLTELASSGDLRGVEGRRKYMNKITNTLKSPAHFKIHPLLVGPTGVGKTETIRGFAHAVARGDYPDLKGKKVFYLNCANIKGGGRGGLMGANGDLLQKISKVMGRHRENIILVLDEAHIVCGEGKQGKVGESLKTWLEDWKENFPYVIAATTDGEYKSHIQKNPAFSRRFKKISMQSMADNQTDLIRILNNILIQYAPHIQVEKDALQYLINQTREKFPESQEPYKSRMILTECIKKLEEIHTTKNQMSLNNLIDKRNAILADSIVAAPTENCDTQELDHAISELQAVVKREKDDVDQMINLRDNLVRAKIKLYTTTLKIEKFNKANKHVDNKILKSQLLLKYYLHSALENSLSSKGMELTITKQLVTEIINTEEKRHEEHRDMMENIHN